MRPRLLILLAFACLMALAVSGCGSSEDPSRAAPAASEFPSAQGKTIAEVPIRYYPRSREEGKKIGARDWFIAVRTFWRYGRTA